MSDGLSISVVVVPVLVIVVTATGMVRRARRRTGPSFGGDASFDAGGYVAGGDTSSNHPGTGHYGWGCPA